MRKKLTLMFVALFAIAAFAATQALNQAAKRAGAEQSYTITFKDSGTEKDQGSALTSADEMIAEGLDYVSGVSKAEKVYLARTGRGVKLGTGSVMGELTLTLKEAVKPTKIVVKARKYNDKGENTININGSEFTLSDGTSEDCEVAYDGNTEVSEIAITAPNKRTYVLAITVFYAEAGGDEGSAIVYDFAAAAAAGENPANLNGGTANGAVFYVWESASKADSKRQDFKGYTWAEGSVLPKDCYVWRRSDRINGNVKEGGLYCPNNREMVINGLQAGSKVTIDYTGDGEILWATGTGAEPNTVAVVGDSKEPAVSGETTIPSGSPVRIASTDKGYFGFRVLKGMVITKITIEEGEVPEVENPFWSSSEAQEVDWNNGKNIILTPDMFAEVNVGDVMHVNLQDLPADAATGNWNYQIVLQDAAKWTNASENYTLASADPYTQDFVMTGDLLKVAKTNGLAVQGTKFSVKKIIMESVYTGSENTIWVGDAALSWTQVEVKKCHFENIGVKAGDVIAINFEKTADEPQIQINDGGWNLIEANNWYQDGSPYKLTLTADQAAQLLAKGLVLNANNIRVTSIELLPSYTITLTTSDHGTASIDKTQAVEGETITVTATADTDYKVGSITVTANGNNIASGSTFTMPAANVTVSVTFVEDALFTSTEAIDVEVPANLGENGSATDLYTFLDGYLQNSENPAYIKLTLQPGGEYTITKSLEITSAIQIIGSETLPATIDASALGANPFVKISSDKKLAQSFKNEKGFATNIYKVEFKNFNLINMKGQAFYANKQKYFIPYLTVDNCILRMVGASKKTFIDFNSGGYLQYLTVNNSTLSGDASTAWQNGGFFSSQSGPKQFKDDLKQAGETISEQKFTITNSTFFNVAKDKTLCTLAENSLKQMWFVVNNNVIINSGKEGQFVVGLNAGNFNANVNWQVLGNSFLWDAKTDDGEAAYKDISEAETTKAGNVPAGHVVCTDFLTIGGDLVKGVLANKLFANGTEGAEAGDFSLGECAQKTAKIGDPRWLSASKLAKYITVESLDDDKDLAKELNKFIKEGFSIFQLEENGTYAVKQPIVTDKALTITGKNVRIGVEHSDVFILLEKDPVVEAAAPALNRAVKLNDTDYLGIDQLKLSGLTVKGLKNSIIYDNNTKYCVVDLTIDDCVLGLATEATQNQAFISFQQGGVKDFTMKNSTVYQTGAEENNYFLRYNNSARLDRYGYDKETETQSINYINNTFYKVGKNGQWGNYNGIAGQAYSEFHVTGNIWVDCGNGQIARRLLGGRNASSYKTCEFNNNTYWFNEAAETGNTSYDEGYQLTTDPGFKKPAEADFTLSAYSEQAQLKTGDPRWYAEGGHYNPTAIQSVDAEQGVDDGAWYTLQGVRVEKPGKGLYIHNGKTVVIK